MKFQNPSIHRSKVNRQTDRQTDRQTSRKQYALGGITSRKQYALGGIKIANSNEQKAIDEADENVAM